MPYEESYAMEFNENISRHGAPLEEKDIPSESREQEYTKRKRRKRRYYEERGRPLEDIRADSPRERQIDIQRDSQREGQKDIRADSQRERQEDIRADSQREGQEGIRADSQSEGQEDIRADSQRERQVAEEFWVEGSWTDAEKDEERIHKANNYQNNRLAEIHTNRHRQTWRHASRGTRNKGHNNKRRPRRFSSEFRGAKRHKGRHRGTNKHTSGPM